MGGKEAGVRTRQGRAGPCAAPHAPFSPPDPPLQALTLTLTLTLRGGRQRAAQPGSRGRGTSELLPQTLTSDDEVE